MARRKTHEEFVKELFIINPQITVLGKYKNFHSEIECKCNLCGHVWHPTPSNLLTRNSGCPACSNSINSVIVGINDLWTTNPEIAKNLKDKNEGYSVAKCTANKTSFICPDCGEEIFQKISTVTHYGLSCPNCSDGYSYPEKVMFNILRTLNIDFDRQKSFGNKFEYDFYIKDLECIIETHGLQHYSGGFETLGGKTYEEEKINDELKKTFALSNGVKNYIEIDCSLSNIEYIKNSIMKSILPNILNFNEDDLYWNEIDKKSQKSILFEICDFWKSNLNIKEIASYFVISKNTVRTYLHIGNNLGLCHYDASEEKMKNTERCSKRVVCLTTNKSYNSISDASKDTTLARQTIRDCCNGKRDYVTTKDGLQLRWCYTL